MIKFEEIRIEYPGTSGGMNGCPIFRAKVQGGWLILSGDNVITFYPDPKHEWDGNSL